MFIELLLILALAFALFVLVWQTSNLISVFFGSLYVGAGKNVVAKALKISKLKKGDVFYDLGCGKGESIIMAGKLGAKAIGYEISPYYFLWSKIRTFFHRNARVYLKNINNVDLKKADVVYCYLLPEFVKKLAPKFKKELKKGTRVVSISFKVPGLKLLKKEKFRNKTIYLYSK